MENPHKNHRERVKNRFLVSGLEHFDPHNIIELLLFFGVPQGDVNPTAHELLNRFGSISGVFDASFEDLCSVKGIGEHCATLIKLMPQLFEVYAKDKFTKKGSVGRESQDFYRLIVSSCMLKKNECIWAYLFDNKAELIKGVLIGEGSVNSAMFETKKVVEAAIKYNASSLVVVHNHPDGLPFPSDDDIRTTKMLASMFNTMGVYLFEHFVVAGNILNGIIKKGDYIRVLEFDTEEGLLI